MVQGEGDAAGNRREKLIMISVCMATYNGARFIEAQLKSILVQLKTSDEVVIVDDCSTDETVGVIKQLKDPRIRLIENASNHGPIYGFMKAIQYAKGDYLFLSDQDDVWLPNKVDQVMAAFEKQQAKLVVHDGIVTDQSLKPIDSSWNHFSHRTPSHLLFKTLVKNGYTGAMMAFSRELVSLILPFPKKLPMHDWWIAVVALKHHMKIVVLSDKLMYYRRHAGNVTGSHKRIPEMIKFRLRMLASLRNA